jgi:hypothetical protein
VLQNEKGVIHIVAERFEDLTFLLARLSTGGAVPIRKVEQLAMLRQRHPRAGDALVTLLKEGRAVEELAAAQHTAKVMPKGRNFH